MAGSKDIRQFEVPSDLKADSETVFPKDINTEGEAPTDPETFHINYLKNRFRDLARPNQFKVRVIPPSNLAWIDDMMVLAKSTSFPSVEVQPIEMERAGLIISVPSNKMNFGELSITFHCDVDMKLRNKFLEWQRYCCYNWVEQIGSIPSLAVAGKVIVYQYDYRQKPMHAVVFNNCWPKSIGEIALSHDTTDATEEFQVSFVYTYQEILA